MPSSRASTNGSIISPGKKQFKEAVGPLALQVLKGVNSPDTYKPYAAQFQEVSDQSYRNMTGKAKDRFQQFFFRVRDDVDWKVDDWFIDFNVWTPKRVDGKLTWGKVHPKLTKEFDREFESRVYRHSADPSCRTLMLNHGDLKAFVGKLNAANSTLRLTISARSPVSGIRYGQGIFVLFDGSGLFGSNAGAGANHSFLFPNTTTLVDIILDRRQDDSMLQISTNATVQSK